MTDVIDFAKAKQEREPHWAGTCRCIACGYEWEGVAPLGTIHLECPSCGSHRAAPKFPFAPGREGLFFVCNHCDSEHFLFYKQDGSRRVMCSGCGFDHTDGVFNG